MSIPNAYESMSKEELVTLLTSKFPEGAKGFREAVEEDTGSFVAFENAGSFVAFKNAGSFTVGLALNWDDSDGTLLVHWQDGCEEWTSYVRSATLQEIRDAGFVIPEA